MTPPKAALGVVKAGKDLTIIFNISLGQVNQISDL